MTLNKREKFVYYVCMEPWKQQVQMVFVCLYAFVCQFRARDLK